MATNGEVLKAFEREGEDRWICIAPVTLEHPVGRILFTRGATFRRGAMFMGVDVAAWLDEQSALAD